MGREEVFSKNSSSQPQCLKLEVVQLSETTKNFTGQPIFSKIKRLVAQGKNGQPSQK